MKIDFRKAFGAIRTFVSANRAEIFIGIGVTSSVTAVVLTVPATAKAVKAKEAAEEKKGAPLTVGETVTTCGKYFVPTIIAEGTAITSTLLGAKNYRKANMLLASGLSAAEQYASDLEKAIPEVVGEEKAEEIKKEVAKTEANRVPSNDVLEVKELTDEGIYTFIEPMTKLKFNRKPYEVKNALANFMLDIAQNGDCDLSQLLDYLKVDIYNLDEETRRLVFNTVFSVDGPNDRPSMSYDIVEREDGRWMGVIRYDRRPVTLYR